VAIAKRVVEQLLRRKRSRILHLDHVESDGRLLFEQIVAMDLERIVCKRRIQGPRSRRNHRATGSRSRIYDKASWKGVKNCLNACNTLGALVITSHRLDKPADAGV